MKKTTAWCGSHIPVLVKLISQADKPILELGVGWSSTPLLHWMALERNIPVFSYESDANWFKNFEEYRGKNHIIEWVENYDFNIQADLSIVFIDHRPAYKRKYSAVKYKDSADYIVLHDSEQGKPYSYHKIYDQFKYKYEFTKVGKPYTLVLSNRKDLSWLKHLENQNLAQM